jgi:cytoskeletal protein CcmA (bactofilin family)
MNVTSSVDLTQLSDTLQSGTTLRGAGNFAGTITGEGDQFKVNGEIKSDALAADNLRLQGLNVSASGSVQGKSYEINGKAVADLLNAGDFQIDSLQLAGNVMGTGTDFRWVGELRAVAEKKLRHNADRSDSSRRARRDERWCVDCHVESVHCKRSRGFGRESKRNHRFKFASAQREQRHYRDVASVKAGTSPLRARRSKASRRKHRLVHDRDGVTSVVVKDVQVGATSAAGAEIGSLNIAGVRLVRAKQTNRRINCRYRRRHGQVC